MNLPPILVYLTIGISVLPFILNALGVDFASARFVLSTEEAATLTAQERVDGNFFQLRGAFTHTLLEWTAFCAAMFTACLAFCHYMISKNITAPIIGSALFLAGCMDAFHTLAAGRLIEAVADNSNLIPFTWAICRIFNALILIVGIAILMARRQSEMKADIRLLLLSAIGFTLAAYGIIHYCAVSAVLPQTQFPGSLITRPYDVLPFLLYAFAGLVLFPRFRRREPSVFMHALIISMIPQCITQLHMALGSSALFDNHFNIAHSLKIVAYLVPFFGLLVDYVRTYKDQQLQSQRREEAEEHLRAVISSGPHAMLMTNKVGQISFANKAAEALFQYTETDWPLLTLSILSGKDSAEKAAGATEKTLAMFRKDGSEFTAELETSAIRTGEGEFTLTSVFDVTEREHDKETLQRYASELAKSNEELDNFAHVASHDLKAPLRAIDNLASWISEDIEDRDAVIEHVQMLRLRSQRMNRLLEDLLEYSRVGREESKIKEVDLNVMARDLFDLASPPKGFCLDIVGELPTFNALATPLEQVLRNLISNAIKHHDQPNGCIGISCRDEGSHYDIIISDDGPGIAAEFHQKIFGMFQMLRARDDVEGSGMGLAMVKKIVENYGGAIALKSVLGEGSEFHVRWPKTPSQ